MYSKFPKAEEAINIGGEVVRLDPEGIGKSKRLSLFADFEEYVGHV